MASKYHYYKPNYHYYKTPEGDIIRVAAHFRPSLKKRPKSHTWIVYEQNEEGKWEMACFPEVTWGRLSRLEYIGKNITL